MGILPEIVFQLQNVILSYEVTFIRITISHTNQYVVPGYVTTISGTRLVFGDIGYHRGGRIW